MMGGDVAGLNALLDADGTLVSATPAVFPFLSGVSLLQLETIFQGVRAPEVTRALIDRGANVNHQDEAGCRALHYVVERYPQPAQHQVIAAIISLGANEPACGKVFLAAGGHPPADPRFAVETVRLLAARGADVNAASRRGWTALHGAASTGRLDLVETLLASGAARSLDAKDALGRRRQDMAEETGHVELARRLREHPGEGGQR
jgi:ankyrin repeat protein